jgi:hypothetical protein
MTTQPAKPLNRTPILLQALEILVIFGLGLIFYRALFEYLSPVSLDHHKTIFSADSWEPLARLQRELHIFNIDETKHPLYFVVSKILSWSAASTFSLSLRDAMFLVLSGYAAANVALVWLILKKLQLRTSHAISFLLISVFSLSRLVTFSVPETYSFAGIFILVFLLIVLNEQDIGPWRVFWASGFIGLAALSNPPLLSLLVILWILLWKRHQIQRWLGLSLLGTFIASLTLAVPYGLIRYIGRDPISKSVEYLQKYVVFDRLLDGRNHLETFLNLGFYSFISPLEKITHLYTVESFQYLQDPLRLLSLVLHVILILFVLRGIRRDNNQQSLALFAWIVLITEFFIYFSVEDMMLYSNQLIVPLLILAAGKTSLPRKTSTGLTIRTTTWVDRAFSFFLPIYVVVMAISNLRVIIETVTTYPVA